MDLNQRAHKIVTEATEGKPEKNQAAVELGRTGGLRGGPARAKMLPAEERIRIARKAAWARWRKG